VEIADSRGTAASGGQQMQGRDLEPFHAAWRYLETIACRTTGRGDAVDAVDELYRRDQIDVREQSQLHAARRLRNLLTHTVGLPGDVPLAVPTGELVDLLQIVSSRLSHQPPTIGEVAVPAHLVAADMPVLTALQELYIRDFSQAPYRCPDGRYRMFTTEQVARWIAMNDGANDVAGITVEDMAAFGPSAPAADVKPTKPTQAAVERLVESLGEQQQDVVPVLIVRDRRSENAPRLFAPADLPRAQPHLRPFTAGGRS
jgi:hypothetical protein